jgi:hypothetical protein
VHREDIDILTFRHSYISSDTYFLCLYYVAIANGGGWIRRPLAISLLQLCCYCQRRGVLKETPSRKALTLSAIWYYWVRLETVTDLSLLLVKNELQFQYGFAASCRLQAKNLGRPVSPIYAKGVNSQSR